MTNNFNIGDKAIVVKNRRSHFGNFSDMIELEGDVVKIIDKNSDYYVIKSKYDTHCCRDENLRQLNNLMRI